MRKELVCGTPLQGGIYKIVKVLGQGSFGITYLATTKLTIMGKLGQMDTVANVAIKEFFMNEMNSRGADGSSIEGSNNKIFSDYRKKFRKEAENLSKLDHPHIVNVLDVFDENNTTYYVMQYIDGLSLDDYIVQNNGIEEEKAISILRSICTAVIYMHSQKMLHLDLKPKNVMMDAAEKIYLIDFGLSKQYTLNGEPESSSNIGAGTPGYAPIEQANYREGKGFPVTMDVYALGGTMYKMLTGMRPPDASTILNEGFPFSLLQEHNVSEITAASIVKAMSPAQKERFQSVGEFLDSFQNGVPTLNTNAGSNKKNIGIKNSLHPLIIQPQTNKVEIEFRPATPALWGTYNAVIKRNRVQITCGDRKSVWSLSKKSFTKFLNSLSSLNLEVRDKANPEYMEASEDASRLSIMLFDENNSLYASLWIGGWHNQFGNLIGNTDAINHRLIDIIPNLRAFLCQDNKEETIVLANEGKELLQIRPDTYKVRIEYWPHSLFPPRYNGAFITTVTSSEVNPNTTQESTREFIPMTVYKFKSFLESLRSLKLEIRDKVVEEFVPGSFSPAKLKITLYGKAEDVYSDVWIDSQGGGNIEGNVVVIVKQIIQIVPGLEKYLNGPFYEIPNILKERKLKSISSQTESTHSVARSKETEREEPSYRWWAALIFPIELMFAGVMLTQSREPHTDSDGRLLSWAFICVSLICLCYLFFAKRIISSQKWKMVTIISTIACIANSCMLPIWNGSVTGAFLILSIGLSLISSFAISIKK